MKTILYGNGLNLITNPDLSWDALLPKIDNNWQVPQTLQCIAPPNTIQYDQLELISQKHSKELIEKLCHIINGNWRNKIYAKLSKLGGVNFLTTNYDLTLESYLSYNQQGKETLYNMYSYYADQKDSNDLYGKNNIWHIHGDVNRPQSIMLGYDHYCKQIAKIREYIPQYCTELLSKNNSRKRKGVLDWKKKSWVDLFFTSDVYILGLGLSYAELDLWWLIDLWARCIKNKLVCNSIVYIDAKEKKDSLCKKPFEKVLKDFGVEYLPFVEDTYKSAYLQALEFIKSEK